MAKAKENHAPVGVKYRYIRAEILVFNLSTTQL
jgi:hypothetical protein